MQRLVGRRSRVERIKLARAHPIAWFVCTALILAVLLIASYLAARAPYPEARRNGETTFLRHGYEIWRLDLSAPVRDGALLIVLLGLLYTFRRWRQAELVRRPGPVEIAPPINATGDDSLNIDEIATEFRMTLGRVDLNSPAAVPGAAEPVEFLELLRGVSTEKSILGTVAGLLGLTWVTHAYRVTAVLRTRDDDAACCGITVYTATLPRGGTPPRTVWAATWSEAVGHAAMAVGASILPLTRLCRRPPWSDWRGLALPSELFSAYMDAKTLATQRRYDEALGLFYEALELDPLNLHIRLEIGTLQEQLQLFLDALETYDDIIALGSRADERLTHAWFDRGRRLFEFFRFGASSAKLRAHERAEHPLGEGWRGNRARRGVRPPPRPWRGNDLHRALLIARYRYAMVLGFSEVVVAQWIYDGGTESNERDGERERLRARLLPRLSHYRHPRNSPDASSRTAAEVLLRTMPHPPQTAAEVAHYRGLESTVRRLARQARKLSNVEPKCVTEHAYFADRFANVARILDDTRPGTESELRLAAKGLLDSAKTCHDKDWSALIRETKEAYSALRPTRPEPLNDVEVLRVHELLSAASRTEIHHLQWDYRWFVGRRRRNHPISASSIRVSAVLADLRCRRVQAGLAARQPDAADAPWPPSLGEVSRRVDRALGRNPLAVHEWQDFYNAACVFAMMLLPDVSWAGQHFGQQSIQSDKVADPSTDERYKHLTAQHAVRALERAIDSSDSNFAAGQRSWVAYEDPDLAAFRTRTEFSQFRARNLASAEASVPLPKNVHVLQLAGYVTEILQTLATIQVDALRAVTADADPSAQRLSDQLHRDRECWETVAMLTVQYRDWRSRLQALQQVRRLASLDGRRRPAVGFPTFPNAHIADPDDVSNPRDGRYINLAGRYARQERDSQFERMRNLVRFGTVSAPQHDEASGPLVTGALSAVEVERRGHDVAVALLTERRRAWFALRDALDVGLFTDRIELLRARKGEMRRLEELLLAANRAIIGLHTEPDPPPAATTTPVANRPNTVRVVRSGRAPDQFTARPRRRSNS